MMQYENRQPPEGINVVEQGWLRDFILLVSGFFIGFIILCWLLLQLAVWSAKWTPFAWEVALTKSWAPPADPNDQLIYLQALTESLAKAGGLSSDIDFTVRILDDSTPNAFATLGGNIVIFTGLLKTVESEQGLAFVIAHELAHVQYRHPIQAITRGISLSMFTALIFGQSDIAQLAGASNNFALLNYSRQQEQQADQWALTALANHYGHVAGADELFRKLQKETDFSNADIPQWLSTHPDLSARIAILKELSESRGYVVEGELTLLKLTETDK